MDNLKGFQKIFATKSICHYYFSKARLIFASNCPFIGGAQVSVFLIGQTNQSFHPSSHKDHGMCLCVPNAERLQVLIVAYEMTLETVNM